MGELIQITGLPRSGTGFMSVFLSLHPDCVAYHELISKKESYKDFIEKALLNNKFVADCSTYGYFTNHSYPGCKKVYLKRNIFDSVNSANKVFGVNLSVRDYEKHRDSIELWLKSNDVYVINFEDLFNAYNLKSIWFYCFGSLDYYSSDKVDNLLSMNIQMQNPTDTITNDDILRNIKKQLNTSTCQ